MRRYLVCLSLILAAPAQAADPVASCEDYSALGFAGVQYFLAVSSPKRDLAEFQAVFTPEARVERYAPDMTGVVRRVSTTASEFVARYSAELDAKPQRQRPLASRTTCYGRSAQMAMVVESSAPDGARERSKHTLFMNLVYDPAGWRIAHLVMHAKLAELPLPDDLVKGR
jgi:hypothetical protein